MEMVFNTLSSELNDEIINKFEGLCEEIVNLAKLVNQKNSYSDFV